MGSAAGKLAVKNHETLPIPPTNSIDVILAEQARMLVEEMTIKGVGDPEIAEASDDAGVDPDPGTPNKGEKEPEKEVPTLFHKRPDCAFYMKTGTCKFGPSCKFNHPAKRTKPRVWSKKDGENARFQKNDMGKKKGPPFKKVEQTEEKVDKVELQTSSRRVEQEDSKIAEKMSNEAILGKTGIIECKFYTTSGGCKYGNSCKYAHIPKNIEVTPIALNFLGLPIRPGKKECPYYMRTGNCKYAVNCWFHHPEPTISNDQQDALPECQIIGSEQHIPPTLNPARGTFYVPTPSTVASSSYLPEPNLHPRVFPFHSSSECNGCQIHTDESSERKACQTRVPPVHQK